MARSARRLGQQVSAGPGEDGSTRERLAALESDERELVETTQRVLQGGAEKYHQKNAEQGKLFARERIQLLLDANSFVEDSLLANAGAAELPADGVITGLDPDAWLNAGGPNDITLPCGRFYISQVTTGEGFSVHAEGRVVLFIDGDVDVGSIGFSVAEGAETEEQVNVEAARVIALRAPTATGCSRSSSTCCRTRSSSRARVE